MPNFVSISGLSYLSGLLVPVASADCVDVLGGLQIAQDRIGQSSGERFQSCSTKVVEVGTVIQANNGSAQIAVIGQYEIGSFDAARDFDPAVGASIFASVISSVLILYLVARSAGAILSFIKSS